MSIAVLTAKTAHTKAAEAIAMIRMDVTTALAKAVLILNAGCTGIAHMGTALHTAIAARAGKYGACAAALVEAMISRGMLNHAET